MRGFVETKQQKIKALMSKLQKQDHLQEIDDLGAEQSEKKSTGLGQEICILNSSSDDDDDENSEKVESFSGSRKRIRRGNLKGKKGRGNVRSFKNAFDEEHFPEDDRLAKRRKKISTNKYGEKYCRRGHDKKETGPSKDGRTNLEPDAICKQKSIHITDDNGDPLSVMCHQCQRNDRGRVVTCGNCKWKRYCVPCMTRWYPTMTEDDFARSCPVCQVNCNCTRCLRLEVPKMDKERLNLRLRFTDEEKIQSSKYIVLMLLPFLKKCNEEQMKEKQIEAQVRGLLLSELEVEKAKCGLGERLHCDNCKTSIADFHRSCTNCAYNLCLICCQELRDGCLNGAQEEINIEILDPGSPYMHGIGNFKSPSGISNETSGEDCHPKSTLCIQGETSNKDHSRSTSQWKPLKDGNISCPPNTLGSCGEGILKLMCLRGNDYVLKLLASAEELSCKYKIIPETPGQRCSCFDSVSDIGPKKLKSLKAASREDCSDNYLYCPNSVELQAKDLSHFQYHWLKGEPVIVSNVLESTCGLSWEPMVMWRAFRQIKHFNRSQLLDVVALNCLNWCEVDVKSRQFFSGYMEGQFDGYGWPQILKLEDWPPSNLFEELLPRHYAEFLSSLSFKEYTNPRGGYLNLVAKLPEKSNHPDIGPKMCVAYGNAQELGRGDSVTKLHCDMTDVVNVLTHIQEITLTSDQLANIEKLKQKQIAQDKREIFGSEKIVNNKVEKQKVEFSDMKGALYRHSPRTRSKSKEDLGSKREADNITRGKRNIMNQMLEKQKEVNEEKSTESDEYAGNSDVGTCDNNIEGIEHPMGGALWDIFRRQDSPKLEEYLRKNFREFRHVNCRPLDQVVHPIHDRTFYLTLDHKRRLKEEYGIEPWAFVQKQGDAVYIPAGCPYQVRNIKSCIKVSMGFVSPENVSESIRLAEETRVLPQNHSAKVDNLEIKKLILYAIAQAVGDLEKLPVKGTRDFSTAIHKNKKAAKGIVADEAITDDNAMAVNDHNAVVSLYPKNLEDRFQSCKSYNSSSWWLVNHWDQIQNLCLPQQWKTCLVRRVGKVHTSDDTTTSKVDSVKQFVEVVPNTTSSGQPVKTPSTLHDSPNISHQTPLSIPTETVGFFKQLADMLQGNKSEWVLPPQIQLDEQTIRNYEQLLKTGLSGDLRDLYKDSAYQEFNEALTGLLACRRIPSNLHQGFLSLRRDLPSIASRVFELNKEIAKGMLQRVNLSTMKELESSLQKYRKYEEHVLKLEQEKECNVTEIRRLKARNQVIDSEIATYTAEADALQKASAAQSLKIANLDVAGALNESTLQRSLDDLTNMENMWRKRVGMLDF